MKAKCLHSRSDQIPTYKDIPGYKEEGEGDCWNCTYHPEENKACRRFYPITLIMVLPKRATEGE